MSLEAFVKNSTVGTLLKGTIVKADSANDNSAVATALSDVDPIGVVLSDIAAGQWGRIVVSGVADVRIDNAGAVTAEMWVGTSAANVGQGTGAAVPSPPAQDTHFRECGHTLQARGGGLTTLVRCIVHFN